jgi:hypothetical protein
LPEDVSGGERSVSFGLRFKDSVEFGVQSSELRVPQDG